MDPTTKPKSSTLEITLFTFSIVGTVALTWLLDLGEVLRGLPHLVVYFITIIWVIGAIKVGFWLARLKYGEGEIKTDSTVNPVAGALMGLLAFMLAFVFNLSMSRFDTRKMLYIEQVNAIENCYRRSNFLPEKHRAVIQEELMKYIDLRIGVINHAAITPEIVMKSDEIHRRLWAVLTEIQKDNAVTSVTLSLVSSTMSSLIEIHNKRVTVGAIYHLSTPIWVALYLLVAVGMSGMGYLFGMSARMNWTLILLLAFSFSAVIILISDLDRSGSTMSIIEFNQQAMIDLKARLLQP